MRKLFRWTSAAAILVAVPMWIGCATTFPRLTEPDAEYRAALLRTADQRPDDEAAALDGVIRLFSDFSEKNLREQVRRVYADEFYFRDGFKKLTQLEELETYLLRSAEPLRSCVFLFDPPIQDSPDYYLRWTMKVNLRRDKPDRVEEVIGLSHFRFNQEGRVVFHQDYWDPTDVLYRRIPIANRLIGAVRARL
jgi:hypothetical protein